MKLTDVKINILVAIVDIIAAVILLIVANADIDSFSAAQDMGVLLIVAAFLAIVVIVLNIIGLFSAKKAGIPFTGIPLIGNIVGIVGSAIYLFLPLSEGILWIAAIVLIVGAVLSILQKK